jgi:hypothetical protein
MHQRQVDRFMVNFITGNMLIAYHRVDWQQTNYIKKKRYSENESSIASPNQSFLLLGTNSS